MFRYKRRNCLCRRKENFIEYHRGKNFDIVGRVVSVYFIVRTFFVAYSVYHKWQLLVRIYTLNGRLVFIKKADVANKLSERKCFIWKQTSIKTFVMFLLYNNARIIDSSECFVPRIEFFTVKFRMAQIFLLYKFIGREILF